MVEIIHCDNKKGLVFILLIVFSSTLSFPSFLTNACAEKSGWQKEQKEDLPIEVTSDRMVSSQKENKVFFYGNVVVVRGDLTIHSNELEIYNNSDSKKTEKITARGNVVIDSKNRHATGDQAVYYDVTQRIILTGNPKAWEDNNEIIGDKMIFLIGEDRLIVEGGGKRGKQIKLKFFPKEKKSGSKRRGNRIRER